jgi:hypothetical protein
MIGIHYNIATFTYVKRGSHTKGGPREIELDVFHRFQFSTLRPEIR